MTCVHCGADIRWASGMDHLRHADYPGTRHCIVNGQLADTVAEEAK